MIVLKTYNFSRGQVTLTQVADNMYVVRVLKMGVVIEKTLPDLHEAKKFAAFKANRFNREN